jgi:hypothetical protein
MSKRKKDKFKGGDDWTLGTWGKKKFRGFILILFHYYLSNSNNVILFYSIIFHSISSHYINPNIGFVWEDYILRL